MIKYGGRAFAIAKTAYLDIMSYKMNMLSIIISHALDLGLSIYLWKFIMKDIGIMAGYTVSDMYVYMSLAVVLNSFFNTPRRLPMTISYDIIDGTIASKLIYPIEYYEYYWWYCVGRGGFFLLYVGLPLLVVSIILFGGTYTFSIIKIMSLLVSILLGYFIETAIALIVSGVVFWTEKSNGIIACATFLAYLFSGRLLPIDFFPSWLEKIANLLPYRFTIYAPISIYMGRTDAVGQIIIQIIWLIILVVCGKLLFKKAYSKVEIAGG